MRRWPKPQFVRGDIVAFLYSVDRRQTYVKRIVGVTGDRINLSTKALIRNEEGVAETYAVHKTDYTNSYRDNFPALPTVYIVAKARESIRRKPHQASETKMDDFRWERWFRVL